MTAGLGPPNHSEAGLSADRGAIRELLAGLAGAPLAEKVARIQSLYERVAFSPSGIIYSMQRIADGEIRPFRATDFEGAVGINPAVGKLAIDGPWDYLHGENSITNSGIYLASQSYRIQVEDSPAAREQAAKAFRSLETIFEMGVDAGKPGWMNKPSPTTGVVWTTRSSTSAPRLAQDGCLKGPQFRKLVGREGGVTPHSHGPACVVSCAR